MWPRLPQNWPTSPFYRYNCRNNYGEEIGICLINSCIQTDPHFIFIPGCFSISGQKYNLPLCFRSCVPTFGKTLTEAKMVSPSDALHYPQIVSIRELIGFPEPWRLVRWFSILWRGVQAGQQAASLPSNQGRAASQSSCAQCQQAASRPTNIFLCWKPHHWHWTNIKYNSEANSLL